MKKLFLSLAALALPFASPAAVDPAIVSADARWLVHADLNALRSGALGKELIAIIETTKSEYEATRPASDGKFGLDGQKILATIGSVTAYGVNISKDPKDIDGTLLVQGTADLRKIAESLLIQANLAHPADVVEITDLPFPAYGVKGPKSGKGDPTEVVIAFPPEPVIIVSKSKPQILKARDVFRGAAPSLANSADSPLKKFLSSSDGTYAFVASAVPAEKFFPDDGPQARVLKMTSAGAIALGERGANTFLHADLVASSGAMADKLMKILQGMTAMMSLAETNDKQLADFLNSATVNRDGDVVSLDLSYASVRLAQMVKNLKTPASSPDRNARAAVPMVNGRALAEWTAEPGPAPTDGGPLPLTTRAIENVALKNGALLTLARQNNGGKSVRFDRVEIVAAEGGAPLVFRAGYMRVAGPRGNWQQFEFPGAEGTYTVKVVYTNDPDGKATFAVSAKDPKTPAPDTEAKK